MSWFRVDDGFYSHPKVLATSLAARGLWASAGSWSKDTHTQGVVLREALAMLGGSPELASELVTAGLWERTRGGYRFHDWDRWQGDEIAQSDRKSSAGTIGNHKRWHVDRGKTDPDCGHCLQEQARRTPETRSQTDRTCDDVANRYPDPIPSGSVVSHLSGSSTANDDDRLISAVITRVRTKTGQTIPAAAAASLVAEVRRRAAAAGQVMRSPRKYVLAAIDGENDVFTLIDGTVPPLAEILADDADVPDWCGECDEQTRQADRYGDNPRRCPACHPETARRTA
jgi:hypothetical protein